jgi:tetratricopeptide (TPR) repeat protein
MLASWSRNSTSSIGKQVARHIKEQEVQALTLIEAIKKASGPYRLRSNPAGISLGASPEELLARLGIADQATSLSRYPEDVGFKFSEQYWKGVCFFDQGQLVKSYGCFRRALRKAPTPQLRAAASFYVRRILERRGRPDKAERLRAQCAGDVRSSGRYEGWARARDLTLAAWLAFRGERWDEAEGLYRQALVVAQRLSLLREIGEVHNGLGEIARKREQRVKALHHYLEALDAWMLADYFWGFQAVYVNLGALYHGWGDWFAERGDQLEAKRKYRLAVEWTTRCTELCREFGLGDDMAEDHAQLASLYRKLGRSDLALAHGTKAHQMALRSGSRKSLLSAMRALIGVHLERGDSEAATGVLAKAALVLRSALPEALLAPFRKRL